LVWFVVLIFQPSAVISVMPLFILPRRNSLHIPHYKWCVKHRVTKVKSARMYFWTFVYLQFSPILCKFLRNSPSGFMYNIVFSLGYNTWVWKDILNITNSEIFFIAQQRSQSLSMILVENAMEKHTRVTTNCT
jgi:hypothetical protein